MAKNRRLKRAAPTKNVESYHYPTAKGSRVPDAGAEPLITSTHPPGKYRYDSSLSPSLEWDERNPNRDQAEALIGEILDSASLEAAKAAAKKLKAMSRPFLNWAGKAERPELDVPTLPLFVHERLSTQGIVETLKGHRRNKQLTISDIFNDPQLALGDQVTKAYEHGPWSNRMILGDNLRVMNWLLRGENMGEQIQMIYMDPPYGIKYGSNFQPFVRKREVTHNDDDDLTREPEMVQAYRDTWQIGLHSYLTYLRDRLTIARDLLRPSGSLFLQIGDDNLHHARELMDELFGADNFISIITFYKTTGQASTILPQTKDYLLWYARERERMTFRQLYREKTVEDAIRTAYDWIEDTEGNRRPLTRDDKSRIHELLRDGSRLCALSGITSSGETQTQGVDFQFAGKPWKPPAGSHWKTTLSGMEILKKMNRLAVKGNSLRYVRYFTDFP
ncbi:MAG: site-specific DNA-methyltransferase, partial [Planctomycetia bacterium]|nr:site-specific DNA-methyltransferase [Planctomycetia bacterium]